MKILVVDDQPINRMLPMTILAKMGFEVMEAESGEQALTAIAAERPDVVLLDISMPGMSGIEVCRQLRQSSQTANLRIIAYTAHAFPAEREEILDAGFDELLIKPIQREALLAIINPPG
jgi:CheY-like chemotaxis protein